MFIIIFGPTGVGKTELSLSLGAQYPIEIINGDSGQFYTPLTIGTAKPDWKNQVIPHHLFDIFEEPRNYSAFAFRRDCETIFKTIDHNNNIPVVVGGSGFYCNALFYNSRKQSTKTVRYQGPVSWEALAAIDAQRASEIHPHDSYRIERALTIWATTQKKPSDFKPVFSPVDIPIFIFVDRSHEDLVDRIRVRTNYMLDNGWIEEVASLSEPWRDFVRKKGFIGYADILNYLTSADKNKNILCETIVRKTLHYVKKQRTFWRGLKNKLRDHQVLFEETNLTLFPHDLYLEQLIKRLRLTTKGSYERESRKK